MKIFGFADLESLRIPSHLLNVFCVIGVKEQCPQAIIYVFDKLQSHQRINHLILINPAKLNDSLNEKLHAIASNGCKIYSHFMEDKEINLNHYQTFAQLGLVVITKAHFI